MATNNNNTSNTSTPANPATNTPATSPSAGIVAPAPQSPYGVTSAGQRPAPLGTAQLVPCPQHLGGKGYLLVAPPTTHPRGAVNAHAKAQTTPAYTQQCMWLGWAPGNPKATTPKRATSASAVVYGQAMPLLGHGNMPGCTPVPGKTPMGATTQQYNVAMQANLQAANIAPSAQFSYNWGAGMWAVAPAPGTPAALAMLAMGKPSAHPAQQALLAQQATPAKPAKPARKPKGKGKGKPAK